MRYDVGDIVKCIIPDHPISEKVGEIIGVVDVQNQLMYNVAFYDNDARYWLDESNLVVISHSVPKSFDSKPKRFLDQLRVDSPEDVPERDDVAPDLCVRDCECGASGDCPRYESGEELSCLDCWNREMGGDKK